MIIPWQDLASETLDNLIKEYIFRELEEHQVDNVELSKWQAQVRQRLIDSRAVIEWSEADETVTIVDVNKYTN